MQIMEHINYVITLNRCKFFITSPVLSEGRVSIPVQWIEYSSQPFNNNA